MKTVWSWGIVFIILLSGLLFSGCPIFWQDNETTIQGIVTITRDGRPLNPEDFSDEYGYNVGNLPNVIAYKTPPRFTGLFQGDSPLGTRRETAPLGSSSFFNYIAWLGDGKYQWSMHVPDDIFPVVLFFDISTQMNGVQHPQGIPAVYKGIKVENASSIIDLGIFNLNVVRLSGILPVSINGDPIDTARMEVFLENGMHLCSAEINADGQWSQYVVVPEVETALKFRIEALKNGGYFRKDLITDTVYTINNTNEEFIFPEYSEIDFNAFTLSGTARIRGPDKKQPLYSIMVFYRDGFKQNTPYSHSFNTLGVAEIRYLNPFGDGSAAWTAFVQEFALPKILHFMVSAVDGPGGVANDFNINITDSTDLNNINLGNIF